MMVIKNLNKLIIALRYLDAYTLQHLRVMNIQLYLEITPFFHQFSPHSSDPNPIRRVYTRTKLNYKIISVHLCIEQQQRLESHLNIH